VVTIHDDLHASAGSTPKCAARIIAYFDTGTPGTGQCPGVPVPSSAENQR
jgi:hypothetical protein